MQEPGMPMTTKHLHSILANLRPACAALPDCKLLARFVADRDEEAFAQLVRRHGPMVMGVCKRLLRHAEDAEDVFQATFLILARKAASVANRDAVGSWLYRVAFRTAQEARAMRTRRRAKEQRLAETMHPAAAAAEVQDWRPFLDQELSRLPEKYQAPLVLCDLEAGTRKEVARQLGIAEGTLSSRLAQARKLLAARLVRRGVTLGTGTLATALTEGALSAHVPGSMVSKTAKAAALVAAGRWAMISASVAVLTKGALKAMFMAKLKVIGGVLVFTALTIGVLGAVYSPVGAQNSPPAGKPANELEALRKENELLKLNLQIVLEKCRTQQAELRALKEQPPAVRYSADGFFNQYQLIPDSGSIAKTTAVSGIDEALKKLREAMTDKARREAADALDLAVRRLHQELGQDKKDLAK
jgi:RNA polymerase sigma factor (sigma-70 family)